VLHKLKETISKYFIQVIRYLEHQITAILLQIYWISRIIQTYKQSNKNATFWLQLCDKCRNHDEFFKKRGHKSSCRWVYL